MATKCNIIWAKVFKTKKKSKISNKIKLHIQIYRLNVNRQRDGPNKPFSWNYIICENKSSKIESKREKERDEKKSCKCLWGYIIKFRILFLSRMFAFDFGKHTSSIVLVLIALVIRCFAHQTSGNAKTFNLSFLVATTAPMLSYMQCIRFCFFFIYKQNYNKFVLKLSSSEQLLLSGSVMTADVCTYIWKGFAFATLILLLFFRILSMTERSQTGQM